MTFLDLAEAFDTVDNKISIKKLERYGIRGWALKLLTNYLWNRLQNVRIQEHISKYKEIPSGVPQGSILDPLLFIRYV